NAVRSVYDSTCAVPKRAWLVCEILQAIHRENGRQIISVSKDRLDLSFLHQKMKEFVAKKASLPEGSRPFRQESAARACFRNPDPRKHAPAKHRLESSTPRRAKEANSLS